MPGDSDLLLPSCCRQGLSCLSGDTWTRTDQAEALSCAAQLEVLTSSQGFPTHGHRSAAAVPLLL